MCTNIGVGFFNGSVCLSILVAVLLRWCTSLYPYSGQGNPPMFGDYEAQRHWMEVTLNLPLKDWYINTTNNDLMYWGLDYPPITAYHSLLCGVAAHFANPNFTKLETSRGYESYDHKLFMRATVLAADLLVYIPAILWFFSADTTPQRPTSPEKKSKNVPVSYKSSINCVSLSLFVSLIYPGLILIDYGHFQYNNISLGFFVAAFAALVRQRDLIGSMLFCLAVSYKQMELYHAIPFFCYLLGSCFPKSNIPTHYNGFTKLIKISITVFVTFVLIWFPFFQNLDLLGKVLHRLFPLARGVFEDKVANIWCSLNVFYKLRNMFSNESMAHICLVSTALAVLPSSVDLLIKPNIQKFHVSLINSSLAFFLFSFQVHEKSILLAAVPIALYFPHDPLTCFWFLFVSIFSMLPLLIKDDLVIPTIALTVIFSLTVYLGLIVDFHLQDTKNVKQSLKHSNTDRPQSQFILSKAANKSLAYSDKKCCSWSMVTSLLHTVFCCSMFGCVVLTTCSLTLEPPVRYPDLFPLLISLYSCIHFLLFFSYFNYTQILSNRPTAVGN